MIFIVVFAEAALLTKVQLASAGRAAANRVMENDKRYDYEAACEGWA